MNDSETGLPASSCTTMAELRREIDRMDRLLVRLVAERLTYIERAAHIKKDRGRVRDEARIEDVIAKVTAEGEARGLPAAIAEPIWRTMMAGFIAHEFAIFDRLNAANQP